MLRADFQGQLTRAGDTVVATIGPGDTGVALTISGTYSGLTLWVEGSNDGTNFATTIAAYRRDLATLETAYPLTIPMNQGRAWLVDCRGFKAVRTRAGAISTGSASVDMQVIDNTVTPYRWPVPFEPHRYGDFRRLPPEQWAEMFGL